MVMRKPGCVLYCGDADGNFVFAVRVLAPAGLSLLVGSHQWGTQPGLLQAARSRENRRFYSFPHLFGSKGSNAPSMEDVVLDYALPFAFGERGVDRGFHLSCGNPVRGIAYQPGRKQPSSPGGRRKSSRSTGRNPSTTRTDDSSITDAAAAPASEHSIRHVGGEVIALCRPLEQALWPAC